MLCLLFYEELPVLLHVCHVVMQQCDNAGMPYNFGSRAVPSGLLVKLYGHHVSSQLDLCPAVMLSCSVE